MSNIFQVDAYGTTSLYFSIIYFKEGGSFHWDSPWIREQVHGEVAELEGILLSNPYGKRKTVQETAKVSIQTLIFFTL
jgi:hypothetical protein